MFQWVVRPQTEMHVLFHSEQFIGIQTPLIAAGVVTIQPHLLEFMPRVEPSQLLDRWKVPSVGEMVQPRYPLEKFRWVGHDRPFYPLFLLIVVLI